jgi:hypothetical protein
MVAGHRGCRRQQPAHRPRESPPNPAGRRGEKDAVGDGRRRDREDGWCGVVWLRSWWLKVTSVGRKTEQVRCQISHLFEELEQRVNSQKKSTRRNCYVLLTFPQSNSEKLNTEKLLPTPHLSKIYKQYIFRFTRRLLDEIYTYFGTIFSSCFKKK